MKICICVLVEYISKALRLQTIGFCLMNVNGVTPPGINRRQISVGKNSSGEEHCPSVTPHKCDKMLRKEVWQLNLDRQVYFEQRRKWEFRVPRIIWKSHCTKSRKAYNYNTKIENKPRQLTNALKSLNFSWHWWRFVGSPRRHRVIWKPSWTLPWLRTQKDQPEDTVRIESTCH